MPREKKSDNCKVCGQLRDGKPGLYCAVCRKEAERSRMQQVRKGLTDDERQIIKEQNRLKKKQEYLENPEIFKERRDKQREDKGLCFYYDRIRKYDLSLIGYLHLLYLQSFKCAVCKTSTPGGKGSWHIDHCHNTNRVRGLLCHYCNTGIGSLRDSVILLSKAITYLR